MDLKFILALVIVGLGVTVFVLQGFLRARKKFELLLRKKLGDYQLRVSQYQKRLGLIEPYASDYMNSLSPESSRALLQLRRMIMAHQRLLKELHQLLLSADYDKFPDALVLLDKMLTHPTGSALTGNGEGRSLIDTGDEIVPTIPRNWEVQAEALLQEVGQEVYRASQQATEIGLPKNRRRKPTIHSLSTAGIIRPPERN